MWFFLWSLSADFIFNLLEELKKIQPSIEETKNDSAMMKYVNVLNGPWLALYECKCVSVNMRSQRVLADGVIFNNIIVLVSPFLRATDKIRFKVFFFFIFNKKGRLQNNQYFIMELVKSGRSQMCNNKYWVNECVWKCFEHIFVCACKQRTCKNWSCHFCTHAQIYAPSISDINRDHTNETESVEPTPSGKTNSGLMILILCHIFSIAKNVYTNRINIDFWSNRSIFTVQSAESSVFAHSTNTWLTKKRKN